MDPRSGRPADSTRRLTRLLVARGALVGIPAAVVVFVLVVLIQPVLAVVLALVVGPAVGIPVALRQARDLDDRVRDLLGAAPIVPADEPRFSNLVDNLAMSVGIPTPRLHRIDDPGANAVVWGSGAGPASIAATSGILGALDRVELEAVVAHLLTRVRTGATEVPTAAVGLFGDRALKADAHLVSQPESIVDADLEAARVTRYPPGAVAALEALARLDTAVARAPEGLGSLWAADPGGDGRSGSHPPLALRLDVLHEL